MAPIVSAADFSYLRTGTRILVSNAHLFGMPQVWEPFYTLCIIPSQVV